MKVFSFQHFSVLFLERTRLCNIVSQMYLNTFWRSVSMPGLLVVALHQALYIVSGFCLSSIIHRLLLLTFLRELYGTGWDQFFFLTSLRLPYAGWLHVAFIDFSQAYDTVPRQQLWSHLRRSATPSTLLSVIKHMYENDEYILMDGEKRARVHPTNGVKQGCPLSPLLFSLYINDMGREISEGIEGAVTGDRVDCVSHSHAVCWWPWINY